MHVFVYEVPAVGVAAGQDLCVWFDVKVDGVSQKPGTLFVVQVVRINTWAVGLSPVMPDRKSEVNLLLTALHGSTVLFPTLLRLESFCPGCLFCLLHSAFHTVTFFGDTMRVPFAQLTVHRVGLFLLAEQSSFLQIGGASSLGLPTQGAPLVQEYMKPGCSFAAVEMHSR